MCVQNTPIKELDHFSNNSTYAGTWTWIIVRLKFCSFLRKIVHLSRHVLRIICDLHTNKIFCSLPKITFTFDPRKALALIVGPYLNNTFKLHEEGI